MILNKIKRSYSKRKFKVESLKRFPSSILEFKSFYDSTTNLEGYNYIRAHNNISSSFIGIGTYVCSNNNLSKCLIGRYCSIGSNIQIICATHPTNFVSTNPIFYNTSNDMLLGKGKTQFSEFLKVNDQYSLIIGNDVWIGNNVLIRAGIKIGDGAIIGMGAVVTKDVPPYAIVGGVPARVIKYRFEDSVIQKLLSIKWWNWDIDILKDRRDDFCDISSFLDKYYEK